MKFINKMFNILLGILLYALLSVCIVLIHIIRKLYDWRWKEEKNYLKDIIMNDVKTDIIVLLKPKSVEDNCEFKVDYTHEGAAGPEYWDQRYEII